MKETFLTAIILFLLQGCGGGDNSTPSDTEVPKFTSPSSINIAENQTSLLTLKAEDDSIVTYSISGIDSDSFNVNKDNGVIIFKTAPNYEEKSSYSFTAKATDSYGNSATQDITIYIIDIVEPFTTVWEVTQDDLNITIPTDSNYTYAYSIDWGDDNIEEGVSGDATHTYNSEGNYTVKISGEFPHMRMAKDFWVASEIEYKNAWQLKKLICWGDIKWQSMENMFVDCLNLEVEAQDTPILKDVNSMQAMFYEAAYIKFNETLNDWNTTNVTDMNHLFSACFYFNQDISNWDVSNVTNMNGMFEVTKFNQDISSWDVSSVTNMAAMFNLDGDFNQNISSWNTSTVISMAWMFRGATSFNQDISNWDVSNVTTMEEMFNSASTFNQDLSNWNTLNITIMDRMFKDASAFTNHDLSTWDVSKVTSHTDFATGSGDNIIEPSWQ